MKAMSIFAACTGAVPGGEREPIKMALIEECPCGRDVLCTVYGRHQGVFFNFFRVLTFQAVKYHIYLRARYSFMQYLMRSGKFPDPVNELILHHVQDCTAIELLGDTNSLIRRILFPKALELYHFHCYHFLIECNETDHTSEFELLLRLIGISYPMDQSKDGFRKMYIRFQVLLYEAERSKQHLQKILGVKQDAVSNLRRLEKLRYIREVDSSRIFSDEDFLIPVPSLIYQCIGSSIESRTEGSGLRQRITHHLLPGNASVDTEERVTAKPAAIDSTSEPEEQDFTEPDADSDLAHDNVFITSAGAYNTYDKPDDAEIVFDKPNTTCDPDLSEEECSAARPSVVSNDVEKKKAIGVRDGETFSQCRLCSIQ